MNRRFGGCGTLGLFSLLWIASISVWANTSDCPDLSSLQPSAPELSKSGAEEEADRLVAEARASLAKGTTAETLALAISRYEQALRIDPRNAPAHLFLASAHMSSQRYLSVPKKLAHERAFEHLAKGREIDPANVVGLYTLADEVFLRTLDYGCVRQILDTALRLEPDNPATHVRYSELLSGIGEFDLAFEHADRALALSEGIQRRGILLNLGRPRYMAGQYDWVLDHYEQFLKEYPGTSLAHFYRSLAYGAKGRYDEALVEAKLAQPDAPAGDAGGIAMLALAYANAGQLDEARQLLDELLGRHARTENVVEYRIAAVYEALGERDKAFEWLEREIEDRSGVGAWLLWLEQDPAWKAMRQDPRFRDILRRSGW